MIRSDGVAVLNRVVFMKMILVLKKKKTKQNKKKEPAMQGPGGLSRDIEGIVGAKTLR